SSPWTVDTERRSRRCLKLPRALRHSLPHPRTRALQLRERLLQRRRSERVQISRIDSYAAPLVEVCFLVFGKGRPELDNLAFSFGRNPSVRVRRCRVLRELRHV